MHMRDITRFFLRDTDLFRCESMTYSCAWHDSFIGVTPLSHMWDTNHEESLRESEGGRERKWSRVTDIDRAKTKTKKSTHARTCMRLRGEKRTRTHVCASFGEKEQERDGTEQRAAVEDVGRSAREKEKDTRAMTRSHVYHDLSWCLPCVPWLNNVHDRVHERKTNVPWLVHMCTVT